MASGAAPLLEPVAGGMVRLSPPRDGGRGASSPPAHTEREPLLNSLTTEPQEMSSARHELA